MNQSFYTSISGAKSYQSAIDVTGTNIANVNTVGYRGSTTEFSDLFSKVYSENSQTTASDLGYGSTVSTTAIDLREGATQTTENTFDLSLSGEGWFGVISDNIYDAKEVGYTRNGAFSVDVNSELVNQSGNYVLGTNFNNILTDANGNHTIDVNAVTPTESVAVQSKLFLPQNMTHPAIATTTIDMTSNLSDENAVFTSANNKTTLSASYSHVGDELELREGESLVLSAGKGEFSSSGKSVNMKIEFKAEAQDGLNSNVTFNVNGTQLTMNVADGATAEQVATTFLSTLMGASIPSLVKSISGNAVTLSSTSNVEITGSSNETILANGGISLATYQKEKSTEDQFSSIDDLRALIDNQINSIYPDSVTSEINTDGKIQLTGHDDFSFSSINTDNSNSKLQTMLSPIDGEYDSGSIISSFAFQTLKKEVQTPIITPSGDTNYVDLSFTKTDGLNAYDGDSWDVSARIYEESTISEDTDLKNILKGNEDIGLESGDDIWYRAGNTSPVAIDSGYGYKFSLNGDYLDGKSSNLSFEINDTPISVDILDGSSKTVVANSLYQALKNSGFEVSIDGDSNVIVEPKDEKIVLTNTSSTLLGTNLEDFALERLSYNENQTEGFKTTGDLLLAMNNNISKLSLFSTVENGQLSVSNSGENESFFSFLVGENSNQDFFNTISSLGGSIEPSSSTSSEEIRALKVTDESSTSLVFNSSGELISTPTLTINNDTETVNIDTSTLISAPANKVLTDSITHNGIREGNFDGYDVRDDGALQASFDNKQTVTVGKVSVFHFQNDQGLERIGGNLFKSSNNSGEAVFYLDGNGNIINSTKVTNKTLESSNVSTSTALTELIIYQRSFEGASRAITTSDQMISQAINMKN